MTARIPQNFLKAGPINVTYDWIDIASATGYVNFYAGNTVDTYRLSNEKFYSDRVASGYGGTAAPTTPVADVDFDIEFVNTRIIEGKTVINVPVGLCKGSTDVENTGYVIVKVRHWDGITETDLVENQGSTITNPTGGGEDVWVYFVSSIDVNIPKTVFKAGETLRLTVELYGTESGDSGNSAWVFGHDPMNRATTDIEVSSVPAITFGTAPSILTFQVPFKLQL